MSQSHRTIRSLQNSELHSETEKRKRRIFNDIILKKLSDSMSRPTKPDPPEHNSYSDGIDPDSVKLPADNGPVNPDSTVVFEKPITEQWIHIELNLPQEKQLRKAKVVHRSTDGNGEVTGFYDPNSFLNTIIYDIKFLDSEVKKYSANMIAENMHIQVDEDSYSV